MMNSTKIYPIAGPVVDIGEWPDFDIKRKTRDSSGPITSSTKKNDCKHDYEFKYVKERITEKGNLVRQDHYFCRRCLEEKVVEK